jgi:hypothetical protein
LNQELAVNAVGSAGSGSTLFPDRVGLPTGGRTALESEVAQCKKQLADLVTCPSSKTPQGKAAMQALADQMSSARSKIDKLPPSTSIADSAQTPERAGHVDTWA